MKHLFLVAALVFCSVQAISAGIEWQRVSGIEWQRA